MVPRSSDLRSRDHFRPDIRGKVRRFVVAVGYEILHRLDGEVIGVGSEPIAHLGDLVKPQFAGLRNGSGNVDAHHVYRQYAAAVFKQVHDGPAFSGGEPIPVMVGGVVIPDGGVEAARR